MPPKTNPQTSTRTLRSAGPLNDNTVGRSLGELQQNLQEIEKQGNKNRKIRTQRLRQTSAIIDLTEIDTEDSTRSEPVSVPDSELTIYENQETTSITDITLNTLYKNTLLI